LNNYDEHCRQSDRKSSALMVALYALVAAGVCLVLLLIAAATPHEVGTPGR
jgi:hypothetical protein